jgi:hypothetical protein
MSNESRRCSLGPVGMHGLFTIINEKLNTVVYMIPSNSLLPARTKETLCRAKQKRVDGGRSSANSSLVKVSYINAA